MKRVLAVLLLICLTLSGLRLEANAASADVDAERNDCANSWRYRDGELIVEEAGKLTRSKAYHPDATFEGIDVSHHQGEIEWEKVKASGIDFAIIRCGYGMDQTEQDDKYFERNASECERLGIPYGVYIYSYATDEERALSEADHVLRLIKNHTLSLPVYFDMEDNSTISCDLASIATAFCNKISEAGYPVGIYSNLYWWNTYLTDPCFEQWHRWMAQFNSTCSYKGDYDIWQYSSTGSVDGIKGNVDMNYMIGMPEDHVQKSEELDIYHVYGQNRYETSFKIAEAMKAELGIERFDNIIIANGTNYADALSGSYLASKIKAPILLTDGTNEKEIQHFIEMNMNKDNGKIYLLGGEAVVPEKVVNGLSGYKVERLWGATRYETNIEILKEANVGEEDFVVCTGNNFADSLSASATGKPILLVKNVLTEEQKNYLKDYVGNDYVVIGGPAVVSEQVKNELMEYDENVERLYGLTRYETSILIAKELLSCENKEKAVLAYGENFPDGLCGGVLAYSTNSPMILTKYGEENIVKEYIEESGINKGYVLGGPTLISDDSVKTNWGLSALTVISDWNDRVNK